MPKYKKNPDFLAIGPEKTGTTTLYKLLSENPQVTLPPCKEVKYWNEGNLIPKHNLRRLFGSKHWHYCDLRNRFRRSLLHGLRDLLYLRNSSNSVSLWNLRYCLGRRRDHWYNSLFSEEAQVTGDISPLYYHMPASRIRECKAYNPNMKVIIFIRDPIERVWSKAKMNLLKQRGRDVSELKIDELMNFCNAVYQTWCPYLETIDRWRANFEKVHLAIYDELVCDPNEWYRKICEFLEIDADGSVQMKAWVNKGLEFKIPGEAEEVLFKQYSDELREVGEHLNLPAWLEKAAVGKVFSGPSSESK